jgi:hypothetical protein
MKTCQVCLIVSKCSGDLPAKVTRDLGRSGGCQGLLTLTQQVNRPSSSLPYFK